LVDLRAIYNGMADRGVKLAKRLHEWSTTASQVLSEGSEGASRQSLEKQVTPADDLKSALASYLEELERNGVAQQHLGPAAIDSLSPATAPAIALQLERVSRELRDAARNAPASAPTPPGTAGSA
jgi:hypothetical protein